METKQIIFGIGEEKYGIDILRVREIENAVDIVPVPNAPACILGIMHLRESVIPIYSLRRKFHLHDFKEMKITQAEPEKLIIVSANDMEIGLLVDSVEEIISINEKEQFKTPIIVKNEETEYIDRVACIDKKIIILLNVDAIVSSKEREDIAQILEDVQE